MKFLKGALSWVELMVMVLAQFCETTKNYELHTWIIWCVTKAVKIKITKSANRRDFSEVKEIKILIL